MIREFIILHTLVILFSSLFFISCNRQVEVNRIKYPIPDENPVCFSSEAQTKIVPVDNITWIDAENPDTDIVEQTDTQPRWILIKNDWVQIRYYQSLLDDDVEITVKENTSREPRKYNLLVYGSPTTEENVTLQIIQEGAE